MPFGALLTIATVQCDRIIHRTCGYSLLIILLIIILMITIVIVIIVIVVVVVIIIIVIVNPLAQSPLYNVTG